MLNGNERVKSTCGRSPMVQRKEREINGDTRKAISPD